MVLAERTHGLVAHATASPGLYPDDTLVREAARVTTRASTAAAARSLRDVAAATRSSSASRRHVASRGSTVAASRSRLEATRRSSACRCSRANGVCRVVFAVTPHRDPGAVRRRNADTRALGVHFLEFALRPAP